MADLRAPKKALRAIPKVAWLHDAGVAGKGGSGIFLRLLIGAGGTALYVTCLTSAYGPASVGDVTTTIAMLSLGWALAFGAFVLSEVFGALPNGHRVLVGIFFGVALAAVTALWGMFVFHRPQAPPVAAKTGARMFFKLGGFTKNDKKIEVSMINQGDVMARIGTRMGSNFVIVDHVLSEAEEDFQYQGALRALPPLGTGIELPVNGGRTIDLEIRITDAQYDGIIDGTLRLYVFSVAVFSDEMTAPGKTNLASVCNHFSKKTDLGFICLSHTESRLQN